MLPSRILAFALLASSAIATSSAAAQGDGAYVFPAAENDPPVWSDVIRPIADLDRMPIEVVDDEFTTMLAAWLDAEPEAEINNLSRLVDVLGHHGWIVYPRVAEAMNAAPEDEDAASSLARLGAVVGQNSSLAGSVVGSVPPGTPLPDGPAYDALVASLLEPEGMVRFSPPICWFGPMVDTVTGPWGADATADARRTEVLVACPNNDAEILPVALLDDREDIRIVAVDALGAAAISGAPAVYGDPDALAVTLIAALAEFGLPDGEGAHRRVAIIAAALDRAGRRAEAVAALVAAGHDATPLRTSEGDTTDRRMPRSLDELLRRQAPR